MPQLPADTSESDCWVGLGTSQNLRERMARTALTLTSPRKQESQLLCLPTARFGLPVPLQQSHAGWQGCGPSRTRGGGTPSPSSPGNASSSCGKPLPSVTQHLNNSLFFFPPPSVLTRNFNIRKLHLEGNENRRN